MAAEALGVSCAYCNCHPCDWAAVGPEIISHMTERYVGCFIDLNGNVTFVMSDNTSNVTKHHL
jgi:hypothetical protein